MKPLVLPSEFDGLPIIASVSGGKDSTALMLALREASIPFRAVFADTGWEAPETYAYLDLLRERIGSIDVVRAMPKHASAECPACHGSGEVTLPADQWEEDDVSRAERAAGLTPSPQTGECPACDGVGRLVPMPGPDFSPMVDRIRAFARFAARTQRWCTRELKIEPLHALHRLASGRPPSEGAHDMHVETVSAIGVRRDESEKRSDWPTMHDDPEWGGWVWAPLAAWTVADVIAVHHRHGVPMNPLYRRGHDRVGCYPCINATKGDIALIAEHAPDRIDLIRALEREASALRVERNAVHVPTEKTPVRYSHEVATFFQGRQAPVGVAPPIDTVVAWSRTSHGGRQLPLLVEPPRGGCFRWGLCEPPSREGAGS